MGCDGGTIPKRDELVRTKQKKEQKEKSMELAAKWQFCAISSNKLVEPIVSCQLGRLYNKDAVIEYLLDKSSAPNVSLVQHIRSLKDIKTLNLTIKSGYNEKKPEIDGQYVDTQDSKFVCPVVGIEMNGKYKFCYLQTCGCVLSERALKEVKSDNCHKCNKEFSNDDIITLNGTEEEIEELKKRMLERRAKEKEMKKNKKRKASDVDLSAPSNESKKKEAEPQPSTSLTTPSSSSKPVDKSAKEYSVAKDPTVSETYKSLFTSHKSAQNKPKAHWVTFNPCYY